MQPKPTWNFKKPGQENSGTGAGSNEGSAKKVKTNSQRTFRSERRSGTRGG